MKIFLVKCPKCGQTMKYMPRKTLGQKRCVYCGKHFNTRYAILEQ